MDRARLAVQWQFNVTGLITAVTIDAVSRWGLHFGRGGSAVAAGQPGDAGQSPA